MASISSDPLGHFCPQTPSNARESRHDRRAEDNAQLKQITMLAGKHSGRSTAPKKSIFKPRHYDTI
jgi:hypothetical protein